jgi:hypothetical protein
MIRHRIRLAGHRRPRSVPGISRSLLPIRKIAKIAPRRSASVIGSTPGSKRVLTKVSTPAKANS